MTKYISDTHICPEFWVLRSDDLAFGGTEELTPVSPSLSKRGDQRG
jgi:hypothetical protein